MRNNLNDPKIFIFRFTKVAIFIFLRMKVVLIKIHFRGVALLMTFKILIAVYITNENSI